MESAPTSPSDNASEDFTIVIINIVISSINGSTFPSSSLLDKTDPKRLKCHRNNSDNMVPTARFIKRDERDNVSIQLR